MKGGGAPWNIRSVWRIAAWGRCTCVRGERRRSCGRVPGNGEGTVPSVRAGQQGRGAAGRHRDGGLRRCFSRELLAPAGELRRGVLRPCGGEAPERRGFLSRLPEMARTARQGRCVRALVPWREGEPFPIPELFCFASVGQGRVTYLFDGEGRPIMPK